MGRAGAPLPADPGDAMQTFLPYADFAATARVLDQRRLGKQRVEALQVLRGLTVPGYGWRHHPAVRMWAGYEEALTCYGLAICREWCSTGRRDTCAVSLSTELREARLIPAARDQAELAEAGALPPWLGDPDFHRSHQSSLLRKDPGHYAQFFPDVPDDLPYVWPVPDRPVAEGTSSDR
ncbi:MSMEG_6728 family protein [Actinoallomurus rhizosphaericola]|uniref:MSMEG_6728 family protein n=1 Tax=Actinoallomurus rhizosphaericola TaxID=2952536 RepID=UPI0020939BBA|nr:MSMEG_6728 family protein [Actinoallomurus rhizosphaericola]MCO6000035.1 MSMEG_6728 family protein [Actinoallomurus rhizosphaericola]